MKALNKRDQNIINLHNQGQTARQIETQTGVSKSTVNRIVTAYIESLKPIETPPAQTNETIKPAPGTNKVEKVLNFGEYSRLGANEYVHKSSGEIIKVKFIPAKNSIDCGYFVKA